MVGREQKRPALAWDVIGEDNITNGIEVSGILRPWAAGDTSVTHRA